MRVHTYGGLEVHIAGGPDREGGGNGPVVILLHGFGAPGDDLVSLWRMLRVPDAVRFVFPVAPLKLDDGPARWTSLVDARHGPDRASGG